MRLRNLDFSKREVKHGLVRSVVFGHKYNQEKFMITFYLSLNDDRDQTCSGK